jgi:hypothetical protein
LTIGRIVDPGRDRAYTPYGISLYAMWLLLETNFAEFPFHAVSEPALIGDSVYCEKWNRAAPSSEVLLHEDEGKVPLGAPIVLYVSDLRVDRQVFRHLLVRI